MATMKSVSEIYNNYKSDLYGDRERHVESASKMFMHDCLALFASRTILCDEEEKAEILNEMNDEVNAVIDELMTEATWCKLYEDDFYTKAIDMKEV